MYNEIMGKEGDAVHRYKFYVLNEKEHYEIWDDNNLFKEIPSTKIYMVPGNHDPIINNSYYRLYEWADNVKIFSNDVEKIEDDEVVIYGYGFNNFEMNENQINNIQLTNQDKINIQNL